MIKADKKINECIDKAKDAMEDAAQKAEEKNSNEDPPPRLKRRRHAWQYLEGGTICSEQF